MTNDDNQIDKELEQLLAPIKKITVNESRLNRWQDELEHDLGPRSYNSPSANVFTLKRRLTEWVVAASIGFAAATFAMKIADNDRDEKKYFDEFDATEITLVAK
jgi:hypothetical protein